MSGHHTTAVYSGAALKYAGIPVSVVIKAYYAWQYFSEFEKKEEIKA